MRHFLLPQLPLFGSTRFNKFKKKKVLYKEIEISSKLIECWRGSGLYRTNRWNAFSFDVWSNLKTLFDTSRIRWKTHFSDNVICFLGDWKIFIASSPSTRNSFRRVTRKAFGKSNSTTIFHFFQVTVIGYSRGKANFSTSSVQWFPVQQNINKFAPSRSRTLGSIRMTSKKLMDFLHCQFHASKSLLNQHDSRRAPVICLNREA